MLQGSEENNYLYTQNRELSWLRFNRRVLEEAADANVPSLERLKFISIFCSNLDEFFMVRVGSLFDISHIDPEKKDTRTGWTATEQLQEVYKAIPGLLKMKQNLYTTVLQELGKHGIRDVSFDELSAEDEKRVNRFFRTDMLPVLSPLLIGANHPLPHLINKRMYVAALLEHKKNKAIGIVQLPASLPPFLMLYDTTSFIRTENILLHWMPVLFDSFTIKESCFLAVTRNADISFDDEKFEDNEEDYRRQMKKLLKKRDHLAIVRLELSCNVSDAFKTKLTQLTQVKEQQIFVDSCPLAMDYVYELCDMLPPDLSRKLSYKPHTGRWISNINAHQPLITQIQQQDHLLFFPYDSFDPFLHLLNEAANNEQVLSIKITIYRLAKTSKIAQALCRAAENGKEVLVLMELRARFDEENNLMWAQMLEEAGCHVMYGADGFKCHSKVCLITLRKGNKTSYITQIGTGNYNEKTSVLYSDFCLMTSRFEIGEDASAFFRNMLVNKLGSSYSQLCVSPFNIKNMILDEIDKQIARGEQGYVCMKANSVTERDVIDKLAEASKAGVEVQLIIRGICCILPGVQKFTENIHVSSIVGRFLEHARVYVFGRGEDANMYISSADLMTRNLNRRVEIACPVLDSNVRAQIMWMLTQQLNDTAKASIMLSDGTYSRKTSSEPFDSQGFFMNHELLEAPGCEQVKQALNESVLTRCKKWFYKTFYKTKTTNTTKTMA